jgi:hypothetical protein
MTKKHFCTQALSCILNLYLKYSFAPKSVFQGVALKYTFAHVYCTWLFNLYNQYFFSKKKLKV